NRPTVFRQAWGIGLLGLAMAAAPASGALVVHYTLDSTSDGLQNGVTGGSLSNLSLYSGSHAEVVDGFLGSALRFSGSTTYTALAEGNYADTLAAYPFTFSFWISDVDLGSGAARTVLAISDSDSYGHNYSLGIEKDLG